MGTLLRSGVRRVRGHMTRRAWPAQASSSVADVPPPHTAWAHLDPRAHARDLRAVVDDPDAAMATWIARPPLAAMYLYPVAPHASAVVRRRARELLGGTFRAHATIAPRAEHLPPRWEPLAGGSRTEQMYRHSLVWLEPLIVVAHVDGDARVWRVVADVIASWIHANGRPPVCATGAWHDHAVSLRVRILCWFFELYRRRSDVDHALARLVVAAIDQHARFLADDSTHGARSNHALEAAGSLLSVCTCLPELRHAGTWAALAGERLEAYVAQAFAADGYSREQSPRYHFFILRRLAALVSYLHAVDHPVPAGVRERLDRAARVWPWLVRDDGSLPRIGDTNERPVRYWRSALSEIGGDASAAAPSSAPNPRGDRAAMLVHPRGIYAVLRGRHPDDPEVADDTHVVVKTDYFRFPHFHHDGLSFVLHALGRDWLIDPGPHSYEYDRWERRYLRSSTAHNVVEVGAGFDVHPVEFVGSGRSATGDRVTVRHHLEQGTHTRTLEHRPPRTVVLRDEVEVTGGPRHVRQLFHAHPDCHVEVVDARTLRLCAPEGDRCTITQDGGSPGTWRIVRGQREPEVLGWWSPRALQIAPTTTCVYEAVVAEHVTFETRIHVVPGDPSATAGVVAAGRVQRRATTAVRLPRAPHGRG